MIVKVNCSSAEDSFEKELGDVEKDSCALMSCLNVIKSFSIVSIVAKERK
jgi:hypothetical protein